MADQAALDRFAAQIDTQPNSRSAADNLVFLTTNEQIQGQPFSKSAATFVTARDIEAKLDWLKSNETFYVNDDPNQGVQWPFSKTAANFKDTREVLELVKALSAKVDALAAKLGA